MPKANQNLNREMYILIRLLIFLTNIPNSFRILTLSTFILFSTNILASDENKNKLSTVVIDPGHGGQDPGALGAKGREKDIVLGIALKLGKLIKENTDTRVIFTRDQDVFIPLHERAEIANRNNADLFISIHANANKNHTVYGSETYAMGLHTNEKNLEVAKKENAVITLEKDYTTHYEGYDPNSAESFIIFTLMQNTYLDQSLDFASNVQDSFEKIAQRANRGVRQAGFLVLWKTTMPSVLIEIGFITNPNEEKFLMSEDGQEKIAKSIFKAFMTYKAKIEDKSKTIINRDEDKKEDTKEIVSINDTSVEEIAEDADSILFRVQIISSNKKVPKNSKNYKKALGATTQKKVYEHYSNGLYKYFVGASSNYNEITEFSKKVKKQFPKAFVVAFKNNKIIPLSDVIRKN